MHPALSQVTEVIRVRFAGMGHLSSSDVIGLAHRFHADGFVVVPGMLDAADIASVTDEMEQAQRRLMAGELDAAHHGGEMYTASVDDPAGGYPHYVLDVARLSTQVDGIFHDTSLLELVSACLDGAEPWEFGADHGREFGVVYQDARTGDGTTYSRIGWHTDHQAYPTSDFFPAVAVTVNLDATSPANGFLRVLPGSHRGGTSGMPPAFEKVDGEVGVYCDAGDVLLHHCDLWHAAARATEDPPGGRRRHLRGSWFAGQQPEADQSIEPFNKNAAR